MEVAGGPPFSDFRRPNAEDAAAHQRRRKFCRDAKKNLIRGKESLLGGYGKNRIMAKRIGLELILYDKNNLISYTTNPIRGEI